MEFGHAVENILSLGSGADSCGRNTRKAYRFAKGEIAGCINVALWHAIGGEVSKILLCDGESHEHKKFRTAQS